MVKSKNCVYVIGWGLPGPFVLNAEVDSLPRLIADEVVKQRPLVPETTHLHLYPKSRTAMGGRAAANEIDGLVSLLVGEASPKILFLLTDPNGCDTVAPDIAQISQRRQVPLAAYVRKERKDIFLVALMPTRGLDADQMFIEGLKFLKDASCNLVLAHDELRGRYMIVTPEQARYCVTTDKKLVVPALVQMALSRASGKFTRTTVLPGNLVPMSDERIPDNLRAVVKHMIEGGAYKDVLNTDKTVGHFAVKIDSETMVTSRRGANFNRIFDDGNGMLEVKALDKQNKAHLTAFGGKPSVGGASQRIVFANHPGYDCIVHAHVPIRPEVMLPFTKGKAKHDDRDLWLFDKVAQFPNECGSNQCGTATSDGLRVADDGIKVVYLDNHGPNIVFRRDVDPQRVIDFIDRNFDLSKHTGQELTGTPQ